jgi:hypothetical protein
LSENDMAWEPVPGEPVLFVVAGHGCFSTVAVASDCCVKVTALLGVNLTLCLEQELKGIEARQGSYAAFGSHQSGSTYHFPTSPRAFVTSPAPILNAWNAQGYDSSHHPSRSHNTPQRIRRLAVLLRNLHLGQWWLKLFKVRRTSASPYSIDPRSLQS